MTNRYINRYLKDYLNDKTDEKQIDKYPFIKYPLVSPPFSIVPLLHASGCFIKEVPNRYPCAYQNR